MIFENDEKDGLIQAFPRDHRDHPLLIFPGTAQSILQMYNKNGNTPSLRTLMKHRYFRSILCSIFIAAILSSCAGVPVPIPGLETPTLVLPTPTAFQQALPPRLVETDPPLNTVIGHRSPITFYFNEAMNKPSVESAFRGLPEGSFTWTDEATLVFQPTQPYPPKSALDITIASSIKSATGFGIQEPVHLSFKVADYLRAVNVLPAQEASDVDVQSAVVVSFNQPVVPLGAEASSLPPAFRLSPSVPGNSEWINTSTYVFYPEPAMVGGTEYSLSLNPDLITESGVSLEAGAESEWTFTTARPSVVSLQPPADHFIPLDPQIQLTFNQPMDTASVESNFLFSGTEGSLNGTFEWSEDDSVLTFIPENELSRSVGYILNLGSSAKSKGGMKLGEEYGTVLNTYADFAVTATNVEFYSAYLTFSSPLAPGDSSNLYTIFTCFLSPNLDS
jgi:hypothetical protein